MEGKQKTLALIEDNDVIREIYETVLVAEGFEVLTASSGAEGLGLVTEHSPDIILLDMLMPDLSGLEFLKRYSPKDHPQVRIIVFSNLMDAAQMQEALDLGVDKYLLKSEFTPTKIAQLLKN